MSESFIRCVTGDIPGTSLGFTDIHEHLFVFPLAGVTLPERLIIDDFEKTREETDFFIDAGGRAVVDAQPFGAGRHPELLLKLAGETGLRIIASTGCHKRFFYPDDPWWENLNVEDITELFVSEIETGMYAYDSENPFQRRTRIKAGIIKIATDEQGITGFYEKVFQAAVQAHEETGAPILTHTDTAASGIEQAAYLLDRGVHPSSIILSHMDRNIEYDKILRAADLEVSFSFDTIARYKYHDDDSEIDLLQRLIRDGFTTQILLGLDCTKDRYTAHGGAPGFAYLPKTFTRLMAEAGITPDAIETITKKNPGRVLSFFR